MFWKASCKCPHKSESTKSCITFRYRDWKLQQCVTQKSFAWYFAMLSDEDMKKCEWKIRIDIWERLLTRSEATKNRSWRMCDGSPSSALMRRESFTFENVICYFWVQTGMPCDSKVGKKIGCSWTTRRLVSRAETIIAFFLPIGTEFTTELHRINKSPCCYTFNFISPLNKVRAMQIRLKLRLKTFRNFDGDVLI